ncbi:MAG: hypothetical protein ACRD00_01280, partial [Thermoanaerobaculia bacterium]
MVAAGGLLGRLERMKLTRSPGAGRATARLLSEVSRLRVGTAQDAIRLHEAALFLSAYPHDARVKARAEAILRSFDSRVRRLEE